jgi:hypothetical protein
MLGARHFALGWNTHHSNKSPWKPKEVPLDRDRILVLDVD